MPRSRNRPYPPDLRRRAVAKWMGSLWAAGLGAAGAARASGANPPTKGPTMPAKPGSAAGEFDIQQLAALLPATLAGWSLATLGQPVPSALPDPLPALQATYTRDTRTAIVSLMTRLPVSVPKGSRAIQQQRREDRQENIVTLPLSNGIVIVARSHLADAAALVQLIEAIDLDRAEKLQRVN